jgi:hypothetical protein
VLLKNNIYFRFIPFLLFAAPIFLVAQKKTEKFLDISISPALGFGIPGDIKPPANYKGTVKDFSDSINKASRPGQNFNFGISYFQKKNAFEGVSFGLSYTTLSFRRVVENLKIGDWIHPQVGYITGVIQAANLRVKYDFRYHYIEGSVLWYSSAEGYGNIKDLDLWFFGGFAPAVLLRDNLHIFTEGFTMNGTNTFDVRDKDITPTTFNLFGIGGLRADYMMFKKTHALLQPKIRIPVLPSTGGSQTYWIPQIGVDIGFIFLL